MTVEYSDVPVRYGFPRNLECKRVVNDSRSNNHRCRHRDEWVQVDGAIVILCL